jgi:hypothetical protein
MHILKPICAAITVGGALLLATSANAQERRQFSIFSISEGAASTTQCFQGLCVSIYINRVNVNGDRVEVCAEFGNEDGGDWRGAYRLTARDDPSTFASMSIASGDTREKCEIVPATVNYWVVLRQDS